MKMLKTSLVAAAALIVLALMLTFTTSGRVAAQGMKPLLVQVLNTVAEPVPVTPVIPAADRVQLQFQGGASAPCPGSSVPVTRIFPDGTTAPAFSVPAGKMLVLTDVEGIIRPDVPWTVGWVGGLTVLMNTQPSRVLLRAYGPLTSAAVSAGMVSMGVHLQSGVVIGSNLNVCVVASVIFPNGGGSADISHAFLEGYLIAE